MKVEGLDKLLAAFPKRLIIVDSQPYLFVGEETFPKATALVKKSLAAGKTVTENGLTQWVEYRPLWDTAKEKKASDRFIWHTDGNRVKCEKIHFHKSDGVVTEERERFVWRDYLTVT